MTMHRRLALPAISLLAACTHARPATAPASRTAPPAAVDVRTALSRSIDSMVNAPQFRSANWGILIVDPVSSDTLYAHNAGKLFMPASNMKIITGAVALHQLGPDFRFRTTFAARGPLRSGTLDGDLVVVGRGDPSVSDAMRKDALVPMLEVADSLVARGVRRIAGTLVAGGDAFPDSPLGYGWAWDDIDYPYSAGVDELYFNEGFARLIARGGAKAGDSVTIRTAPARSWPRVRVEATTATIVPGTRRPGLETSTDPLTGDVVLRGVVGVGDSAVVSIAYRDQNGAYLSALREALATRGITVGQTARATSDSSADTLFTVLSPPLREIMPALEKPSQNQIAEILFKTVGLERAGVGTADSGRRVIERQLREWGVPDDGVAVRDGSGLSRHDYVTPETIVKVLDVVRRGPNFQVFYDALPIAGVDGTIARRMKGTPAENNVHAKTGSVDKARSLSGYVRTADGRMLLFSFLCNNFSVPLRAVEQVQDAIAARLASLSIGASTAGR